MKKFSEFAAGTQITESKKKLTKESVQSDVGLSFVRLSSPHLTQILDNSGYDLQVKTCRFKGYVKNPPIGHPSFKYSCVLVDPDDSSGQIEGDVFVYVNGDGNIRADTGDD